MKEPITHTSTAPAQSKVSKDTQRDTAYAKCDKLHDIVMH